MRLHSSTAQCHMGMPLVYHVFALKHLKLPPADVRATTRRKLWRLVASGGLLAAQWGAYAWAVGHTSLSHTLLFLSATPVLLAGWHWAARQPISAGDECSVKPFISSLEESGAFHSSPPACHIRCCF